jgi:cytochrome P450
MSLVGERDSSKVVDLDLGSSDFKQNARNILAEWAKRPPFYVFSSGPPQVICGRYADVHEVFSDTERFSSELPRGYGFEQFDKFMGVQFITQMDGERHARIRRLLMPAFSARSLSRLEKRITEIIDGMLDKSKPAVMSSTGCRIMEHSWWSGRCSPPWQMWTNVRRKSSSPFMKYCR